MKRILCIGDTHFPFHSKAAFTYLFDFLGKKGNKFDLIIQMGDLFDLWSMSRWPKSQNAIKVTAAEELLNARVIAEEMWQVIRKRQPKARLVQLVGNHDIRWKHKLQAAPELEGLLDLSHMWNFPCVETIHDERHEFVYEGICFMHGYRSKLGDHAKYNLMPTVCGHSHRGGIWHGGIGGTLWELNAGHMADVRSKAMSYTRQRWVEWTRGFGIIDELGPRFVNLQGLLNE